MINRKVIISLAFIYALTAFISLHVPMNSDDYAYSLRDLSLDSAIGHYMEWSGRIVSDFISTSLLTLFPRSVYLAINALILPAMAFFMAKAASAAGNRSVSPAVIVFIFLLYFVANPSLGQTTFWIVGSANYLWTNMFISAYIAFSIWIQNADKRQPFMIVMLFILSVLAGCSNENTAAVVVLVSACILAIEQKRKIAFVGLVGSVIGAAILLLSPGNVERAKTVPEWYDLPFATRMLTHFTERLPEVMGSYWQIYLAIVILLIVSSMSGLSDRRSLAYCLIFSIAAVLANVAFAFSPGMPERAWNGGFCFMLMASAFAASMAFTVKGKTEKSINTTLYLVVVLYFSLAYALYFTSINAIKRQAEIRDSLIEKAKLLGQGSVDIPDHYFPPVHHRGPSLDTFNSQFMSEFYGLHVNVVAAKFFDYSVAFFDQPIAVNVPIRDGLILKNVWLFKDQAWLKNYVVYEFDHNPADVLEPGIGMFIHIVDIDGYDSSLDVDPQSLVIDGRFLNGTYAGKISASNAKEIIVGTWEGSSGRRLSEHHAMIRK